MEVLAGVDEAGRGPWAGPVVAAAVILDKQNPIEGLRDSKKLTPKKRDYLFNLIIENSITYGIGIVDQKEIDRINILQATYKAMQMALARCKPKPEKALIDGYGLPNQIIPNEGIIKGDDKIDSIRAASILAKVTRDRIMGEFDIIFPEYGFKSHKGYGTAKHSKSLSEYKATPIHRLSFKPVKEHLPSKNWYQETNRIGWIGEKLAALKLRNSGHTILTMNHHSGRNGEIDIISTIDKQLIFTEVKTVSKEHNLPPEVKFDKIKSAKIENSIKHFIQNESFSGDIRLDLITVDMINKGKPVIKHYEGLFLD